VVMDLQRGSCMLKESPVEELYKVSVRGTESQP
jgi:hypothetical protein